LPYHEWYIEFENEPDDIVTFAEAIDDAMRKQNMYYDDLIVGNILRKLVITKVTKKWLSRLYEINRKTWGQNKIPRLLMKDCGFIN
jgi:hypothetical protein